jgi:hypothetical protein
MKRLTEPLARNGELSSALQRVMMSYFGERQAITNLRHSRSVYASSCNIENLEFQLGSRRRLSLVLKDLSPTALVCEAQGVRPRFLYDPLREIEIYRQVLVPQRFGTPVFYGSVQRPKSQQYWLLLEQVNGPLLWQVGEFETWRNAARWLAKFHCEFDRTLGPSRQVRPRHLLQYDRRLFALWLTRAVDFLRTKCPGDLRGLWRRFTRLTDTYDRVISRLLQLPRTLIHGEFYPSNILVRRMKRKQQICPIDWELAAIGPGLIDLAALTSGDWSPECKKALVAAYREALEPLNGWPPQLPELLEAVDYCQLHLCVQWLGWAAEWSPPKLHARNWLQEMLRLGDGLAL